MNLHANRGSEREIWKSKFFRYNQLVHSAKIHDMDLRFFLMWFHNLQLERIFLFLSDKPLLVGDFKQSIPLPVRHPPFGNQQGPGCSKQDQANPDLASTLIVTKWYGFLWIFFALHFVFGCFKRPLVIFCENSFE